MKRDHSHERGPVYRVKRCPECDRRLSLERDFYVWSDSRHVGELRERVTRICKDCTRKRNRARYRRVMADPYLGARERAANAARQKRYRDAFPGKNAEKAKRYRERIKREDPERYQAMLEDMRIRSRLARMDTPTPPKTIRRPFDEPKWKSLKPEPLVDFLRKVPPEAMPEDGMDARRIRALFREDPTRVSVRVADRLVTHYGGTLATVYPELYG